jgi:excisionase family DNA binding protein
MQIKSKGTYEMSNQTDELKALSIPKFAKRYGVHPCTVHRWLDKGRLKAVRIGDHRLVLLDSVPAPEEPKQTVLDAG